MFQHCMLADIAAGDFGLHGRRIHGRHTCSICNSDASTCATLHQHTLPVPSLCGMLVGPWHMLAGMQDTYSEAVVVVVLLHVKVRVNFQHLLQGVDAWCHKLDLRRPAAHGKCSRAISNTVHTVPVVSHTCRQHADLQGWMHGSAEAARAVCVAVNPDKAS